MAASRVHSEWLSLVEISGPFLTLPVLTRAFPAGLEPTDRELVEELRVAYAEVTDDPTLSPRFIRWVLERLLDLPDAVLRHGAAVPGRLSHRVSEYAVELLPDYAVIDPDADAPEPRARLLVAEWPWGIPLDERPFGSPWAATPTDRMEELCRATGVRLGLVTNGETWTLLDAPAGGARGTATWGAELWLEERSTLDAFTTLLGARRFFSFGEPETLEALLAESANAEAEVTDQLGQQVRRAVELLIDAWSRVNRERHGQLFGPLTHAEVYEGAVTVLMRLVFLLCAEERGLFVLGDPLYDSSYAVSTLRAQLEEEANTYGEDVLERHSGAWHRLLATFRMVHAGAQHENLSLPAYGGSLFDPDRFEWLEGRHAGEPPGAHPATPVPVDDRTVLHILDALQVLRFRRRGDTDEARHVSFRTLDVEQIGHVYEGLLDHGAVAVDDVVLGLSGKKEPELLLDEIEAHAGQGSGALASWLVEQTGLSAKAVAKALEPGSTSEERTRLASACDNEHTLVERITPYLRLLRQDLRGLPRVWLPGSVVMTQAGDRRSSGTYYTPKALAEEMVRHALEPLAYQPGPVEGANPEDWKLRPSAELLDLHICDMAMGSGAFLVAACRYLAARVLEAWSAEGLSAGDPVGPPGGETVPLPGEETDREILALRLVADRCLYGVDRNPMAVEMAKLSLWLVTLAKDRPFSFLNHALRTGDSLLGVTSLEQIEYLHLDPAKGAQLHGGTLFDPTTVIRPLVDDAVRRRREIESFLVLDVADAETKRHLFDQAHGELEQLSVIANVVVGASLSTAAQSDTELENRLLAVAPDVRTALDPDGRPNDRSARIEDLRLRAEYWLDEGRPPMAPDRECFHWPLEFPEVFLNSDRPGFDAVIGNPPFLGGVALARTFGEPYERLLKVLVPESGGFVDLAVYFHRRAQLLVDSDGVAALLGPQNLVNSANRQASTDVITKSGKQIAWARRKVQWPGSANLYVCTIGYMPGSWRMNPILDGQVVSKISASLDADISLADLARLRPWIRYSQGTDLYGASFIKPLSEWEPFILREPALQGYLRRYVNADILCSYPESMTDVFAVDFGDKEKEDLEAVNGAVLYLEETVGRERSAQTRQIHESRPWLHWDKRLKSYELARSSDFVMACPRVSKHLPMLMVDSTVIFGKTAKFFPGAGYDMYALLQSEIFLGWAFATSPLRGDGIEFSTRSSLDPFPPPGAMSIAVECCGEKLWNSRKELMVENDIGVTDVLNRMHSGKPDSCNIVELRRLQVEVDQAIAAAYGWEDLPLNHDFWETRQGMRFTVGPEARVELLDRLLELNHERFAEEVRLGLHDKKANRAPSRRARSAPTAPALFEVEQ